MKIPTFMLKVLAAVLLSLAPDIFAESAIAEAAEKENWARVAELLNDEKAAVNDSQVDGMTALHWAAFHDHPATVKALLQSGAEAVAKNRYDVTPLSLACTNGNADIVKQLLEAGANPNTTLPGGETVLMTAVRTGKTGPVELLLKKGAKVDAKDRKGQTALMWVAAEGHANVVALLVSHKADPNYQLKSGFTPMLFAARNGHLGVVDALLKSGVDVDDAIQVEKASGKAPRSGTSALRIAVENGHFELATRLLDAGANPNDQRSGHSPLHVLIWVRKPNRGDGIDGAPPPEGSGNLTSLEFAKLLITKYGANPNLKLNRGSSGSHRMGTRGATPFLMASKTADLPYLKLLHDLGADPTIQNHDRTTPLLLAAGLGTHAPTEEAGTEEECLATVEWLLSLGANINARNQRGDTAMHGAVLKSLPKMVAFLAANGADIEIWNQKNKAGRTPLLITQGFRPGNFKPAPETREAVEKVMRANGIEPPAAPKRSEMDKKQGYEP